MQLKSNGQIGQLLDVMDLWSLLERSSLRTSPGQIPKCCFPAITFAMEARPIFEVLLGRQEWGLEVGKLPLPCLGCGSRTHTYTPYPGPHAHTPPRIVAVTRVETFDPI